MQHRAIAILFGLVLALPAGASVELLLRDGQTLKGVEVHRDGSNYMIGLESGGVLAIPVSLVDEVRLTGKKEDKEEFEHPGLEKAEPQYLAGHAPIGPTELRTGEAETLAGEDFEIPTTKEQLEVFGEPSKFSKGVIDPEWRPQSDFASADQGQLDVFGKPSEFSEGPMDPDWQPESAFDADRDVWASSVSDFKKSPIDSSWSPQDGFKKKTSAVSGSAVSVPGPVAWMKKPSSGRVVPTTGRTVVGSVTSKPPATRRGPDPRTCAARLLSVGAEVTSVSGVDGGAVRDERYGVLPFTVYEAFLPGDDEPRAVFAVTGGKCRLLGGDRELLGVEMTRTHAVARGAAAFNSALADGPGKRLTTRETLDYAFASVSLLDRDVSGRRRAELQRLDEPEDLEARIDEEPKSCSSKSRARKKGARQATKLYSTPRIHPGADGELVEFVTWSSADGAVVRHAVWIALDGRISLDRETLAEHVGAHRDLPDEPAPAADDDPGRRVATHAE